uniref:non-specific serine/threonine protein kinase n=1 Tax=Arcella intermedia TaxID=1963864 RepID=A0A6B2L5E2_9EUKA
MALQKKRSFVIKTSRENLDMSSEEEEEEEEYRKGGYHPVDIDDCFNNKYKILAKLGWGHFSTVWLARDIVDNRDVALKIVKSAHHYTEAARDEIKILHKSTSSDPNNEYCVVRLLDHFEINGPNGLHVCMVFEKVGCNLLTLIRMYKYKGLPLPVVKIVAKQILIGVAFLHRCFIIHTDLKPENLLLVKTPMILKKFEKMEQENGSQGKNVDVVKGIGLDGPWCEADLMATYSDCCRIKIVDLGNACWTFQHFTDDVQTRQYRAPEVILGARYDSSIDVWSIACIIFELLTGDLLFEPKSGKTFEKNDDHLAQIQELLGAMPKQIAFSGKLSSKFFNQNGELRYIKNLKFWPLKNVLCDKYKFNEKDASEISDFLLPMLVMNPKERITAEQALENPWVKDVDVNDFRSTLGHKEKET